MLVLSIFTLTITSSTSLVIRAAPTSPLPSETWSRSSSRVCLCLCLCLCLCRNHRQDLILYFQLSLLTIVIFLACERGAATSAATCRDCFQKPTKTGLPLFKPEPTTPLSDNLWQCLKHHIHHRGFLVLLPSISLLRHLLRLNKDNHLHQSHPHICCHFPNPTSALALISMA